MFLSNDMRNATFYELLDPMLLLHFLFSAYCLTLGLLDSLFTQMITSPFDRGKEKELSIVSA